MLHNVIYSDIVPKTETTVDDQYETRNTIGTDLAFKREIVWFPNVLFFSFLHLMGFYGIYIVLYKCCLATIIYVSCLIVIGGFGVTGGAHRLYCHRTYKANVPYRLLILAAFTMAGQNSMYRWVLDHRQHHKYTDTDADPHNATRGFFFSHIGWLMSRPHPAVQAKRRTINMSDLDKDSMIMLNRRYYYYFFLIMAFIIPVGVPIYFFNETYWDAFIFGFWTRYAVGLNAAWSVNSVAHMWGSRPFDKNMKPRENYFVALLAIGEGWHNYHHAFPWDYKASEYLVPSPLNVTTTIIDFCSKFGWTYDLKFASEDVIKKKILISGDGTHRLSEKSRKNM